MSIERTIREADDITIVFLSSEGPKIPIRETVERQEYTLSFSSSGRGRLLDVEILERALEENLERIRDSIKHLAKSALYRARIEAVQEARDNIDRILHEVEVREKVS